MLPVIVQMKFKFYLEIKKKNERNRIHTPRFFLRQVTCNSFRHTVILLKGITAILKYINRIMYRIIQGKGVITRGCAVFTCISWNVQGHFSKELFSFSPSIWSCEQWLQWLNCVWKARIRKIKISFMWICAVKQVCKFCLSVFWATFWISYQSRLFALVYGNFCSVCPIVSGYRGPGGLHQVPTAAAELYTSWSCLSPNQFC